jgi:hypothetical protein
VIDILLVSATVFVVGVLLAVGLPTASLYR